MQSWYVGMNLNSQKKDEQWDVCLEYFGEKLWVRYQEFSGFDFLMTTINS